MADRALLSYKVDRKDYSSVYLWKMFSWLIIKFIIYDNYTQPHPHIRHYTYKDLDKNEDNHFGVLNLVVMFSRNLENHCNLWSRWKELQTLLVMFYSILLKSSRHF